MEDIDAIRIQLSQDNLLALNACLAFVMFGIALDIKLSDFRRVAEYPRGVATGLVSQLLLLPLITIALLHLWGPHPSVALGLIMVAVCPGGNISNFAVHLSKGNTALSVTMTSVVTGAAIVITPLAFPLWSWCYPPTQPLLADIRVAPVDMFRIILQLIIIPLIIGMTVQYRFPKLTRQIRTPVRKLSIAIFGAFIIFALLANSRIITQYLHIVFLIVVVHNLLALAGGYHFARLMGLGEPDRRAISMETGIQNAGLGLILIFNFFGNLGGMMLVAAFWGVWDLISSFILAMYWNHASGNIALQPDSSTS